MQRFVRVLSRRRLCSQGMQAAALTTAYTSTHARTKDNNTYEKKRSHIQWCAVGAQDFVGTHKKAGFFENMLLLLLMLRIMLTRDADATSKTNRTTTHKRITRVRTLFFCVCTFERGHNSRAFARFVV